MTTTTTTTDATTPTGPAMAEQAPILLTALAGYVGHRTISMGIRRGLVGALDAAPGTTTDDLADRLDLDPFYTGVWCRSALACGLLERDGDGWRVAPYLATLLLDLDSPAYVGGVFGVFEAPEMFDDFEERLASGERTWWDQTSDHWIEQVSGTGTPFYLRLVPGGLDQVPGLAERLDAGCRVVDTACGAGTGVIRLATTYPACEVVGVDGDERSVAVARDRATAAGVGNRVSFVTSPLEEFVLDDPADVVINNISMHECRDIDEVAQRVRSALRPGGVFVISDFPFPDTDPGLQAVPGRIMSGIQFFEAQIDDQLVPRAVYDDLLERHDFADLGTATLTPLHALTWGWVPATD